jgi:hypothetical protein
MQLNGKYSLAFFGVAVIDLAVISECLHAHVSVNYASNSIIALVEILFLSLMSMDAAAGRPFNDKMVAFAIPQPSELQEIAKRVEQYGIDGEHTHLTRAHWMRAIANDQTQDSYWEWVTKNEILAKKLLRLPGMSTKGSNNTAARQADKFSGFKLLRGRKISKTEVV